MGAELVNIKEYYTQVYLPKHKNVWCRRLHFLGNLVTLAWLYYCITSGLYALLLIAPFIIYPFAWTGHFMFEHNTPAAFSRPLFAKAADWMMMFDILRGKELL